MSLESGSRLGPYEIVSRIGAGGMGEVFRARDTRLGRSVAIKVLPPQFATDPRLRSRFDREAKIISQLNHPHICTLHDVGSENGTSFLVLELVEGESLAERLARGAMPLPEVLRYGAQIADALDRAHRAGIVHRDLKPGNVMITKTGAKLLDFGLANAAPGSDSSPDAPTEQVQQPLTSKGMIVGTLPYMSPEQLQGQDADPRSDIFALGAMLYEMLTGKRAFAAPNSASLIAKILEHHPQRPSELQSITPQALEDLVMTCLEKDADARFQCAADVAHQLRWIAASGARPTDRVPAEKRGTHLGWAVAAALAILATVAPFIGYRFGKRAAAPQAATFQQLTFDAGREAQPSIAPDGKLFVFVKTVDGQKDIFLQRVDGRSAINLTKDSAVDDVEPAFSPDGTQIAFRSERDGGGIFVMGATGESVRRLTDSGYNASWSPDGKRIVYAAQQFSDPTIVYGTRNLYVVDVATGAVKVLSQRELLQPNWSPHGHRIAFWTATHGQRDIQTIASSGDEKTVVPVTADVPTDWNPVWSADGKFLYFVSDRSGTMSIWRIAIDEESGKVLGAPSPVQVPAVNAGFTAIARNGEQIIFESTTQSSELLRTPIDPATLRLGTPERVFSGSMNIRASAQSPDGKLIAFNTKGQEDIFVMNADGTGIRQLTNDLYRDRGVSWFPDGSRISFYSNRAGNYQAFSIRPDGSGLTQLSDLPGGFNWGRVSPDQKHIAYIADDGTSGKIADLTSLPAKTAVVIPDAPKGRLIPWSWSSDGKWIAAGIWGEGRSGLYAFSVADRRLVTIPAEARIAAFIDDHRILFVDVSNRAGVADVNTGNVQVVGTVGAEARDSFNLDTASIPIGGRAILTYRSYRESDIWQARVPVQ